MKLISLYTNLDEVGGANNLTVDLHKSLMETGIFSDGKVSSFTDYKNLAPRYKNELGESAYERFKVLKFIKKADELVFLSHHRKMTTYLLGISRILKKELKIVHVAHSTLSSLKFATLFPEYIVAVSNSVRDSLKSYFKVEDAEVIYNGVLPQKVNLNKAYNSKQITVTLPASINNGKQQVALTKFLRSKLVKQVVIQFAGDGPERDKLEMAVSNDKQFKVLGHIDNMQKIYENSDYVMLFSKMEGLPLSLIEAQSHGIPIICNDVGGNLEILKPNENGFFVNSMPELLQCLNSLPSMEVSKYIEMRKQSLENYFENFQYDKMVESYADLLQEVMQ
ncbi:MAG TPA: glycosyltransferase family 4 protein [Flavobacteriaceae bacterium]|nr:glycosyltransferase family 4 protein [Flavobacteriaceae bacterium]